MSSPMCSLDLWLYITIRSLCARWWGGSDESVSASYFFQLVPSVEEVTGEDLVVCVLKACHNSRVGHFGARRTYQMINKMFPGYRISIRAVMDFVSSCIICQKYRLGMADSLEPLV